MLAPSFKTADDLDISTAERNALIALLGMLERGELRHDPEKTGEMPNGFNMDHWGAKTNCGTIGCIRGWARFIACDQTLFRDPPQNATLLFTVDQLRKLPWPNITPMQASFALRSYLSTGEARWEDALA